MVFKFNRNLNNYYINSTNQRNRVGFTFIELLIALAVLAILFVPVMQLFSQSLYFSSYSQEVMTAVNLAKWDMERMKNLNFTKEQLREADGSMYPDVEEPPLEMNGLKWRIEREIVKGSDPVEVRVSVYRSQTMDNPLISLVTLIEDMTWVEIKPVK
ncbi:MAG: prepilin-type N-terminal cleavage/methylation domain-containing protein [Candidatus Omnitrophota bacterium]